MEKLLGMANPEKLFCGAPNLMAGEQTHESIEVGFTTRWSILLNSHKYLMELYRRQRKAAQFSKQRKPLNTIDHAGAELLEV